MHFSLNNCFQTNSEMNTSASYYDKATILSSIYTTHSVEHLTWEMRSSMKMYNSTVDQGSFLARFLSRTVLALFSCSISSDSCGPKVVSKIKTPCCYLITAPASIEMSNVILH